MAKPWPDVPHDPRWQCPTCYFITRRGQWELSLVTGWMELIVDSASSAAIRLSNGVLDYVTVKLDTSNSAASIGDDADANWKCDFVYRQTGDRQLTWEGRINGNPAAIKLHRVDN